MDGLGDGVFGGERGALRGEPAFELIDEGAQALLADGKPLRGIHADDTTVPVLAKNKTRTGRLWTYVRDDRPFGGQAPPAAIFFYSPDRGGEHPEIHLSGWAGIMQADAYAGYTGLYDGECKPAPIIEAACSWRTSGNRRKNPPITQVI